jgi:uncharacterized Ntn-hydrolase superfamily protein
MKFARVVPLGLAVMLFVSSFARAAEDEDLTAAGTFSIIARDPATGELGMGVQSKTLGVGSRTISAVGGLAVIAHQATSNPMYGVLGVDLLRSGMTPEQALQLIVRGDDGRESRQVAMLDAQGRTAAWTGKSPQEWKGHRCANDYCVQGNILVGPEVIDAMARSFESSKGPLAERLVSALDAGQQAGGDARGRQSAALVVAKPLAGAAGFGDRPVDLRVDDHRVPLVELRRLLNMLRSNQLALEATAKLREENVEAALGVARAATEKSPENDNAWVTLATVHVRGGRKADALAAIRKAVELNESNRRRIPQNAAFKSLTEDPEFQRLTAPQ